VRALLCSLNYAPELTGIGKYTGEMAEWLAANGVEVTVVTAPPYYPAWRVARGYSARRYESERLAGVNVIRCPVWVPRRASGLKRLLHLASFAITSLPVLLWSAIRLRPALVLVVEPPLFAAPAARLAAKLAGATAWLHIQDFEVDAAFNLGMLRTRALRKIALALETRVMQSFHCVSTISERMLRLLAAKRVATAQTRLFPNWVDLDRIRPLPHPTTLRARHFKADQTVVLYSGNMGAKQGLRMLVETAKLLAASGSDKIRFVFCGDGVRRHELEGLANGAANIEFWPLVSTDRLNELLNTADIHVLPQRADVGESVFPSKLTNMLASGRPVIATANPGTQIAEVLEGCGVVVPPSDPAALAAAIRELAADPERRQALGAAARAVAEQLWDKNAVLSNVFGAYVVTSVENDATIADELPVMQQRATRARRRQA
jgi:colanic acid biosynthesis glycosyl transferase WcaI